ncbi:Acetylornithine deacetylase/Succinyl-diaminopimelate desuccinylase [Micrococcales bacterium KH10]|nr:Acetylornithine deacetylase/Succinyl-diaminopimelate desuccinylase [Micrococcales bacterium KH10]
MDEITTVSHIKTQVAAQFEQSLQDLEELVRIPSVSAPSFDQATLETSANRVAELLEPLGFDTVRVVRSNSSRPAVLAHRPAPPGAPTVLLYAHHDVQPPGERDAWNTDPFEPTRVDERLYGRGAADDKAGIMVHIAALRALGDDLKVGVTVFIEGEEEIGSPAFGEFLSQFKDEFAADVIVVADSANWKVGIPALTTSLRGLVTVDVELRVLEHAVHSGMFGGPVLDSITLMSRLIATLHDDNGDVAVAGLVHAPEPLVDMTAEELRGDAAVIDSVKLAGTGSLTSRLWTKPAINVIGLDVPDVAHSSNTIVPRVTARLSVRIAPGQDPDIAEQALGAHIDAHVPFGAEVTWRHAENAGRPFLIAADDPAMQAARTAMRQAWGTDPVDVGIGGSIPLVADLNEIFPDAAILVTGVEDPDSRAHGANESVHLGELQKAVVAEALLLRSLGEV